MKKLRLLLALTVLFAISISAFAQEEEDEERWRSFEITVNGGLTNPTGSLTDWEDSLGAKSGFHFGASGGYYFTERICAGLYFNYTQLKMDDDWSTSGDLNRNFRMYDAGIYVKYAFAGESDFEPYLKLTAGTNWPKFPTWVSPTRSILREQSYDPEASFGGYAGCLYYTSDYGGIFFELGYHNDLLKNTVADYHGEKYAIGDNANYFELRGGITVFFGPEE